MSYTFTDFTATDEHRGINVTVTLHSSTSTTATWKFLNPHTDGQYPDVKWDAANANNSLHGWELGSGAGTSHTLTYEASTGKMVYFVPSPWYHKFDTSAGRTISGDGTNTEGVSVANGSITTDAFGALYFTVDKSSPLTVGTHDYGFYLDGFLQGTINHSLSTLDAIGYQNNPSDGLWQLSYQGGSSVEVLASYTVGRKKVFCNFW